MIRASVTDRPGADRQVLLDIEGMHCASCVGRVQSALAGVPGVAAARVNLGTEQASVEFDSRRVDINKLLKAVERSGYKAVPARTDTAGSDLANRHDRELASLRRRLLLGAAVSAVLMVLPWLHGVLAHRLAAWIELPLATVVQVYLGWMFYRGAVARLWHGAANMDTLIAIGTTAAYLAGVGAVIGGIESHYLMDSSMILTFITLGKFLEAKAKGRASSAIRKLLDLTPPTATIVRDGRTDEVPLAEVEVGQTLLVRPGEKVPIDARVVSGSSSVDQSWLTGESLPVDKWPGEEILAGTINGQGSLTAEVVRTADDTALAQVIALVRRAQESKAGVERLADRVVAWFVPAVLLLAAITFLTWGLAGDDWPMALKTTVAVLVVACPCALGLATPTAIMVASGRGAESGILIKEAQSLEIAARLTTVVLDKTGTVTLGRPAVQFVLPVRDVVADELLSAAAAAERLSQHPLARSVVAAAEAKDLTIPSASDLQLIAGQGVRANVEHGVVLVGNERLMTGQLVPLDEVVLANGEKLLDGMVRLRAAGQTPLLVARDGRVLGVVAVADTIAPESRQAIADLKSLGLSVHLLTGDHRATAESVATQVGIEHVEAEVLPAGKESVISHLRANGEITAMVGDGVNDAPALAAADLGIAIGAGSDVAIEAAGVVLVGRDLSGVARLVRLSRATLRTIRQNLGWAFVYNLLLLPLAAGALVPWFGWTLPPVAAAAAMAASSVSVVANSLLLRRTPLVG